MTHFYMSIFIFLLLGSCGFVVLTTKIKWYKKVFIACALISSGLLSYRVLNTVYGYPALLQDDYEDVLILGYWPDKEDKKIYIWIKLPDKVTPLSYKMPYSIGLHKTLEQGRQQHKGKPYRSGIKGNNYPLEKFDETVDEIELVPLPMVPPKNYD